jgi:hypothetical protein
MIRSPRLLDAGWLALRWIAIVLAETPCRRSFRATRTRPAVEYAPHRGFGDQETSR